MNGSWLGRRNWLWLADGVLVAVGIVFLVIGNDAARIFGGFIAVARLVAAGIQVLIWRRGQAAQGSGGVPPR